MDVSTHIAENFAVYSIEKDELARVYLLKQLMLKSIPGDIYSKHVVHIDERTPFLIITAMKDMLTTYTHAEKIEVGEKLIAFLL